MELIGATDAYLTGWQALAHGAGCAAPSWQVDIRREERYRPRRGGPAHSCPNADEECGHSDRYERITVRAVCTSCGAARLISGEEHSQAYTTTAELGYGSAPIRKAGLWLWPGPPLDSGWLDTGPWDYLVTRERVARVTADDVVALVGQGRGPRGGTTWWAVAVPDPNGKYGYSPLRHARNATDEGARLSSLGAAVRWVAAALAAADQQQEQDRAGEGR